MCKFTFEPTTCGVIFWKRRCLLLDSANSAIWLRKSSMRRAKSIASRGDVKWKRGARDMRSPRTSNCNPPQAVMALQPLLQLATRAASVVASGAYTCSFGVLGPLTSDGPASPNGTLTNPTQFSIRTSEIPPSTDGGFLYLEAVLQKLLRASQHLIQPSFVVLS